MDAPKLRALLLTALLPLAVAGCQSPGDPAYCSVSRTGYEHALTEVNQRLSDYQGCIAKAIGPDDCSSQFSALSSAQSNFQHGANDIDRYCSKNP